MTEFYRLIAMENVWRAEAKIGLDLAVEQGHPSLKLNSSKIGVATKL